MIQIADLSYLENVPENQLILGAVGADVTSSAKAEGDKTFTSAEARTKSRTLPNGFGIAIGYGTAEAIGENPTANVTVKGEGDIVNQKTKSFSQGDRAFAWGFVVAIEFP